MVDVHVVVEELMDNPVCADDPTPPICGPAPAEPYFIVNEGKINSLRRWVTELSDIFDSPTFCVVKDANHGSVFDGNVVDALGDPIMGFYYGDEAALSLFGYGVNRSGLCLEIID